MFCRHSGFRTLSHTHARTSTCVRTISTNIIKLHGVPGSHFMMSRCCKQHWMMYISGGQDIIGGLFYTILDKCMTACIKTSCLMGKNTEQRKTDQQVTMKSNWIRCTEQAVQLYNLPEHMLLDSLQACNTAVVSIVQAPRVSAPHSLTAMMTRFSMA